MAVLYTVPPSYNVPDEEKFGRDYIMSWGKYIELEWLGGGGVNNKFARNRARIYRNRQFGEGTAPTDQFRTLLGVDDPDKAAMALDWRRTPVIPKYVNLVVDGFEEDIYKVNAKAIDPISLSDRERYRKAKQVDMYAQDYRAMMSSVTGQDYSASGSIPDSEEDLELHMQMEYKPEREIAIEITTDFFMDINGFKEIKKKVDKDLVENGIGCVKHDIHPERGIELRYVDPVNILYSYDTEDVNDKRGIYYFGEVRQITIAQLRVEAQDQFTEEEYKSIANSYSQKLGNGYYKDNRDIEEFLCEILEYTYQVDLQLVYKKKNDKYGGYKMIRKADNFNPKSEGSFERVDANYQAWFKGKIITSTDLIYDYGICKNLVRPKSNLKMALSPYVLYETDTMPLVERMIPLEEQLQIVTFKLQHLIATARPKGIAIDIDAIQDISLGSAGDLEPADIVRIYNQRGDLLYSGSTLSGDLAQRLPITELPNGIGQDLQQLVNLYNHYLEQIRAVTGVNEIREGNTPSSDALVGVQKLALAASNNATKHISRASLDITKRLAEGIVLRVQDLAENSFITKGMQNALGEENVQLLQEYKDLHNWEFGVTINVAPTEEERAELEQALQIALQSQQITISDYLEIKENQNVKLAIQLLKLRLEKNKRDQQEMAQVNAEMNAQQQQASVQAAAEAKAMEIQQEYAAKAQYEAQVSQMRQEELRLKYYYEYMIEQAKAQNQFNDSQFAQQQKRELEEYKQDRLDQRIDQKDTNASQLISQRGKENAAPVNFEQPENEVPAGLQQ